MKHKNLSILSLCLYIALLVVGTSCTTKKNTFFYRTYHGTTAKYNIIFNGNESYKEAVEIIDASVVDNYTAVLPVFPRPGKTEALAASPQLDRSIEKCSKAIKKHSMLIKGTEHCKPIDDAYLLMGKSYFQRQDYGDALSVFSYVINTHKNGNVWPDAHTWKARANLALNRMDEAEVCLEEGRAPVGESSDKKQKQHWEATYAEFLLMQKDYELATVYLSELLKHKRMKKDFKTRIHFILGQTYQQLGQRKEASQQYATVLKRNPTYQMDFNATINLALCGANDAKSKHTARERLKKLLKEAINEQYKDQIFHAMAQLDLQDEDTNAAIKNLEASVFWSINNNYQKTVSALQLAELYFDRAQYEESQMYYDTVVNIIPTTFPDYAEIKERASILKNLVENLMIIKTQDELQKMARMGEEERLAYVDKLIAEYNEKEAERNEDNEAKAAMMENTARRSAGRQSGGSGAWMFYNPTQVRKGMQDFRGRWGNRQLKDYWFLEDIEVVEFFTDNTTSEDEFTDEDLQEKETKQTSSRSSNPQNRNYYLQDVPMTEEQMAASDELIASGLFNSGFIYSDDLNDYQKAVKQWEDFLSRYPNHKLKSAVCFQLYETYAYLKENEKSEYYKNLILQQYPNSNYAKIIQNPNYYQEVAAKQKEGEEFYASVYNTYTDKDYQNTILLADEGLKKYPTPTLSPKFDFLKAVSLGKLYGNDTLHFYLTEVTRNYPATDIDTAAMGILEGLKRIQTQTPIVSTSLDTVQQLQEDNSPIYTYDDQRFHYVIIIANIKEVNITQLKGHLNNFNGEFFRLNKFDISSFFYDDVSQIVTISRFDDKSKAMDYYHVLKADKKHVEYLHQAKGTKIYVISDTNYTPFCRQKDIRVFYDEFFKEYYLK